MVNPFQGEVFKQYLEKYGFALDNDLVVEANPIGRLLGFEPYVLVVQQYERHPITRDSSGVMTIFPMTRSIGSAKVQPKGISFEPLARTSAQSWGETNRSELDRGVVKPDPEAPKGPLTVAAVATKDQARLGTVDAADVDEMERKRGAEAVTLKRESDGWRLLVPVTARGDRSRVDETLTTLTTARVDREIESAPTRLDQYGLDKPAAAVT